MEFLLFFAIIVVCATICFVACVIRPILTPVLQALAERIMMYQQHEQSFIGIQEPSNSNFPLVESSTNVNTNATTTTNEPIDSVTGTGNESQNNEQEPKAQTQDPAIHDGLCDYDWCTGERISNANGQITTARNENEELDNISTTTGETTIDNFRRDDEYQSNSRNHDDDNAIAAVPEEISTENEPNSRKNDKKRITELQAEVERVRKLLDNVAIEAAANRLGFDAELRAQSKRHKKNIEQAVNEARLKSWTAFMKIEQEYLEQIKVLQTALLSLGYSGMGTKKENKRFPLSQKIQAECGIPIGSVSKSAAGNSTEPRPGTSRQLLQSQMVENSLLKKKDRVVWLMENEPLTGIVRWIGNVDGMGSAGIEFDEVVTKDAAMDDKVKQYFVCKPGYGIILRIEELILHRDYYNSGSAEETSNGTDKTEENSHADANTKVAKIPMKKMLKRAFSFGKKDGEKKERPRNNQQ